MKFLKKKPISVKEESQYLKVISRGDRRDFIELIHNATKIHSIIQKSSRKLILLDFTLINFYLPQNEAYHLVNVFEQKLTEFKEVRMAILTSAQNEEMGHFWVTICRKRNFDYKNFKQESEALEWLLG
jgi:response regulator of citrate/malate metabolism